MLAYLIARFDMTDPMGANTAYPKYVAEAGPAYKAHGARFLVRGGTAHAVEGAGRARNVVIEYPSLGEARACYNSEAYQGARRHRLAVAEGEIVLVEGLSSEPAAGSQGDENKGYWISRNDVSDVDAYKLYVQAAIPAFEHYGARFLTRGGASEGLEGVSRSRNVLIEFPSVQHALDCFHSETYTAARAHRAPIATGEIVIVQGA